MRTLLRTFALGVLALLPSRIAAQVFNGGSLVEGIQHAGNIAGLANAGLRTIILRILLRVLDFLALAAVVFIVIAGIYLIAGGGTDESKEKAKKIILYVIIGLLVIFFARLIVGFFLNVLQ